MCICKNIEKLLPFPWPIHAFFKNQKSMHSFKSKVFTRISSRITIDRKEVIARTWSSLLGIYFKELNFCCLPKLFIQSSSWKNKYYPKLAPTRIDTLFFFRERETISTINRIFDRKSELFMIARQTRRTASSIWSNWEKNLINSDTIKKNLMN